MKIFLYVVGGVVCVGLIIAAMYVAMTIGLSVYIAHTNNERGRLAAERQRAAEVQQQQQAIASWGANMTPGVSEEKKAQNEESGKAPTLITDPEGYGIEDNWLATIISREIAEMAFFAAQPNAPLPDLKVKATVDPAQKKVHVELTGWAPGSTTSDFSPDFAWDPNGYASLARQLVTVPAMTPAKGTDHDDVVANLLELTGPKLASEDVRLSANLQARPASWQDHEAAALLLMALALRDEYSIYGDNRTLLCRATAHMALAQAWRKEAPATWAGLIADAAIRTVSGRELDALTHLDDLAKRPDLPEAAKPWIAALRMLATQDWRKADVTKNSPLLLKIVWFRVLVTNISIDEASRRLGKIVPQPQDDSVPEDQQKVNPDTLLPDFSRIAGRNPYYFYDDARDVVKNADFRQNLELHELDEVLQVEKATPLDAGHLDTVFAEGDRGTIGADENGRTTVEVIGVSRFKASSLGHLLASLGVKDTYDNPDQDVTKLQEMFVKNESLFKDVPGYEIARLSLGFLDPAGGNQKEYDKWTAAKKTWAPWKFPYEMHLLMPGSSFIDKFYKNAVPFGTVYEPKVDFRYGFINAVDPEVFTPYNTPELDRIKKLPIQEANTALLAYNAKYNELIRNTGPHGPRPFEQELLKLNPDEYDLAQDHLTQEKLLPALSHFLDYNINASYRIGKENKKSELSKEDWAMVLRKRVALDPYTGFEAATTLRHLGLADEAAEMDRQAFASGGNAIGIANSVLPLVDYDLAHGLNDEAIKVAKFAGEVSSELGLETLTYAMEKLGRLDEAEAAAKQDAEQYSEPDWLTYFQLRHPDRYPQLYADELKSRFSDGLQHAKLGDFTGSPKLGALISSGSDILQDAGMKPGDVIVALDGYRVESEPQYMFVRSLSLDSKMDFVIWRKDKYIEVKAVILNRRMMVDIVNFTAQ